MMLRSLLFLDVMVGAAAGGLLFVQEVVRDMDCGPWQTLAVFLLGIVLPPPSRWEVFNRGRPGNGQE